MTWAIPVDGTSLCASIEAFTIKEASMEALFHTGLGSKLPPEVFEMIGLALRSTVFEEQQKYLELASRFSLRTCPCSDGRFDNRGHKLWEMVKDYLDGGEKAKMVWLLYLLPLTSANIAADVPSFWVGARLCDSKFLQRPR